MAALEKHYTVAEVASLWQLSEELQTGAVQTWEVGYAAGLHGMFDK
jgi:hypothetical protein